MTDDAGSDDVPCSSDPVTMNMTMFHVPVTMKKGNNAYDDDVGISDIDNTTNGMMIILLVKL